MKHLCWILALLVLPTLSATADEPAASLEQLAAQIFVADGTADTEARTLDLVLDGSANGASERNSCANWIQTCADSCAPCGIKKVTCATGVCICNPPC